MSGNTLKYSVVVFAGGACYGVMATTVKLAYAQGFSWMQAVASQALFGLGLFAVVLLVLILAGRRPQRLTLRGFGMLLLTGACTCSTCILYNIALSRLSVATAITLLFQFTWIGIVIEVLATRRMPNIAEIIAAIVIIIGTPLASGLFSGDAGSLDPLGVVCGLLSAVSCALFMFMTSRVGVGLPTIERGFFICLGAGILGFIICPDYFASGGLQHGLWIYGLVLGAAGLFFPVLLFAIGTPHLPPGISTIMASSELPCAIVLSCVLLPEAVTALQVVGVIVVVVGVVISQLPSLLSMRERN